jgi:hypothetical protein
MSPSRPTYTLTYRQPVTQHRGCSKSPVAWEPWTDVHNTAVPGVSPRPSGGILQKRSGPYTVTCRWETCSQEVTETYYVDESGRHPTGWQFGSPDQCTPHSSSETRFDVEFRWVIATQADPHLLEILARRGTILRIPPGPRRAGKDLPQEVILSVNGLRSKPSDLDTTDWKSGTHWIAQLDHDDKVLGELLLHVVDPISIEPKGEITAEDDPEGSGDVVGFAAVTIRNRSNEDRLVRLVVADCPAGWTAWLNEPMIKLGPRASTTAMVQARLVSRIGVRRQLEPIVITATTDEGSLVDSGPAVREINVAAHVGLSVDASDDALAAAEAALKGLDGRRGSPRGERRARRKQRSS